MALTEWKEDPSENVRKITGENWMRVLGQAKAA